MKQPVLRTLVACVVLLGGLPALAQAQIYAWKDTAGHWVLSDRPKDPSVPAPMTTYAVQKAVAFRSTRDVTGLKAGQYDSLIDEQATAQGVSPHLVRAVIQQESGFNARARSNKGAMGLMQLMPGTAADLGVLDPYNPVENVRAGVTYLKGLLTKFSQNVELALAAYNAGPAAVTRYGAVPPYRETRNYVTRITSVVGTAPAGKPRRIYKTVDVVNGREIPRYSNIETPGSSLVGAPGR